MKIDQPTYLRIVQTFLSQPAHRRPSFLAASKELGIDRRTLARGWTFGWPATKDLSRPALPPLAETCAAGLETSKSDEAQEAGAATTGTAPETAADAAARSRAESSTPEPPAVAMTLSVRPDVGPTDPIAEMERRQRELRQKEHEVLRATLTTAANFRTLAATMTKAVYEHVTSPGGQEILKSYFRDKPGHMDEFLERMARVLDHLSKTEERVFTMSRLAEGLATSVQEIRVAQREPAPEMSERSARLLQRLQALRPAAASAASASYQGENVVIDVEPLPAAPLELAADHDAA